MLTFKKSVVLLQGVQLKWIAILPGTALAIINHTKRSYEGSGKLERIARSMQHIARILEQVARSINCIARILERVARSINCIARILEQVVNI